MEDGGNAGVADPQDFVGAIVERWREIRPDLDSTPMLVAARIIRLAVLLDNELRPPFAAAGLATGDFDLLAALRRQGPPHEASPGQLAAAMLVTTGAATKRVDRLEAQGYVSRRISNADRRGRVVGLTKAGLKLTDDLYGVHLANEARILQPLTPTERDQLARLLATLGASMEQDAGVVTP